MRNFILVNSIFLLSTFTAMGQTITFDTFLLGSKVGSLTATKKKGGDLVFYEVKANNTANILGIKKHVETSTMITIKGGYVIESLVKRVDNGKLKSYCNMKWDGTKYQIETEKGKRTYDQKISLVTMEFYFSEPKSNLSYFYNPAAHPVSLSVSKKDGAAYTFKTDDGVKHTFIYKNGVLDEIENSMDLATVRFRKSN